MTNPFTFAIITDTHIRAPGGDFSSPFPVNEKANGRARYAALLVARQNPDLTIHLGDMVHPLPHMSAYKMAAEEADNILRPLQPNFYAVPGNHDIGDKPSPGMPAKSVTNDSLNTYRLFFGSDWGKICWQDVNFLWINSSLVNSGLSAESEQRRWLEHTLEELKGQRILLFSHYPPFIYSVDEQDHYDNYAEPGRSWLLNLASDNNIEAIFSGHVHHFFFNRYNEVKLYCLPATSFIRQDYAELFPVEPTAEFGRDDTGKFGITLVDINESGHQVRIVPTNGQEASSKNSIVPPDPVPQYRDIIPHLRHSWFEGRYLTYNGPMEEFTRKQVRNDYPLLRLLQLGIKYVRIPLSNLTDPLARSRVFDWASLGFKFVFFKTGFPTEEENQKLSENAEANLAVEIVLDDATLGEFTSTTGLSFSSMACPVWINKITSSATSARSDRPFAHMFSAGIPISQLDQFAQHFPKLEWQKPNGIVFQIEWGEDPAVSIERGASIISHIGAQPVANLRFSQPNPAIANTDISSIESTLDDARKAASGSNVILQCDRFEDVDRGYCPRMGFIDRHCNLRTTRTKSA